MPNWSTYAHSKPVCLHCGKHRVKSPSITCRCSKCLKKPLLPSSAEQKAKLEVVLPLLHEADQALQNCSSENETECSALRIQRAWILQEMAACGPEWKSLTSWYGSRCSFCGSELIEARVEQVYDLLMITRHPTGAPKVFINCMSCRHREYCDIREQTPNIDLTELARARRGILAWHGGHRGSMYSKNVVCFRCGEMQCVCDRLKPLWNRVPHLQNEQSTSPSLLKWLLG